MNLRLINPPSSPVLPMSLGTATIENRALFRRRVMQVVTIPFNEADGFRLGDPVTVLDSGTGQPERCQVESWAMRYPNGSERIIRLHYPAVLAPNALRIQHTFERSLLSVEPQFVWSPSMAAALQRMSIVFFAGPKSTHFVPVVYPGAPARVVVDGPRMKKLIYFARLYEPAHAPTLRTQFWCEVELHLYSDSNHALAYFRWGIDDPRIDSHVEPRAHLSVEDSEVGFDVYSTDLQYNTARLQPCAPQSNTHSLTWDQSAGRWRWVWDRATRNVNGVLLNHVYPWGLLGQARCVITMLAGETDQLRIDSAEAWHNGHPGYHYGISNAWRDKSEAYAPWGAIPRRPKAHEYFTGPGTLRTPDFVRAQLENEGWVEANARGDNVGGGPPLPSLYAFNHRASNSILDLWHQNDGQTGGEHAWWHKNPHVAAALYAVPALAHHVERAMNICPFGYSGFREIDGRMLNLIDHPEMENNRGAPGGDRDRHGKSSERPHTSSALLLDPLSAERMIGADTAHFESPHPYGHAAVFGDDGARLIAETWSYGPLHLGYWNARNDRIGSVSEQRGWARGCTMWAWALWLFGNDRRLVDRCADVFFHMRHKVARERAVQRYPNSIVHPVYWRTKGDDGGEHRVYLRLHDYYRPWEICHASGEHAIARLAAHIRPELDAFRVHAKQNAEAVFRYGSPRVVDEATGQATYTFLRPGANGAVGTIYEPAAAVAIALSDTPQGGSRQLLPTEMADNNWTRCAGNSVCGDPPTNDGYMRLGVPSGGGTSAFVLGMAHLILDGPLSAGDPCLHRYADSLMRIRERLTPPSNRPPHMSWLGWSLFRRGCHRLDDVNQGNAQSHGTHGVADLTHVAWVPASADVFVVRSGSADVQRRELATGNLVSTFTPGATPLVRWTGIAVAKLLGEHFVALIDGLDLAFERHNTYRIVVSPLATPHVAVSNWTFRFADDVSRNVHGIAWMPQLLRWVIGANHPSEGPSVWTLDHNAGVAARVSLPMQPTSAAQIILDVPSIASLAVTQDGRMMVVSSAAGNRHYYIWNTPSRLWGIPRLTFVGDIAATFTDHDRDDDDLRIVTATEGANFWSHPI